MCPVLWTWAVWRQPARTRRVVFFWGGGGAACGASTCAAPPVPTPHLPSLPHPYPQIRALIACLQPGAGTRLPWGAPALRRVARRRATSHARRGRRPVRPNAKLAVRDGGVEGEAARPTNRAMRRRVAGGVPLPPPLSTLADDAASSPSHHRLPTHAWHAKRMAMVDDAVVAGWRLPASAPGAARGDRAVARRVLGDGAVAVDASYWRPVVVESDTTDHLDAALDAIAPEWRAAGGATAAARAGRRQVTACVPAAGAPVHMMWDGCKRIVVWAHAGAVVDVLATLENVSATTTTTHVAPVARLDVTGAGADRIIGAALAACGVAGRDAVKFKAACGGGGTSPANGIAFSLTIGDARQLAPLRESEYAVVVAGVEAGAAVPLASVSPLFGRAPHRPPPSTAAISADRQARRRAALGLPTAGTEASSSPRAPLTAIRTRPPARSRRGAAILPHWALLLPWSWAPVLWRELVAPGRAAGGGGAEARWAATTAGVPFFPHDWPSATAAAQVAGVVRGAAAAAAAARPPGKRRRVADAVPWREAGEGADGGGDGATGLLPPMFHIATQPLSPWPPHACVHVSVTARGGDVGVSEATRVRHAAPPPPPGTRITSAKDTLLGFVTSAPSRGVPPRVGSMGVVCATALWATPRMRGGRAADVVLTLPCGRVLRGGAEVVGACGAAW